ncbi:MAG: hypothetical protein ACK40X_11155 [Armatimonadota bacterium]
MKEKGVFFVIRLSCNWWVKREGRWEQIKFLGVKRGKEGIWLEEVLISRRELIKLNLLAFWDEGKREGWYLATNLPTGREAKRCYGLRMRIEECFRDKKSKMRLKELWRWKRRENVCWMLLMVAFVLLFLFWLYRKKVRSGWGEKQRVWGRLSYVSLALEWIDRHFQKVLFPMELVWKGGEGA